MGIRVLDEKTIAHIAAGEVVERPASVLKELLENAIDAGGSRIEVELQGGGIALMQVSDNGIGIPSEEVPVAFQRHATSKLPSLDSLYTIETLGFRGEALPSIAAVAEVEMTTCNLSETAGTMIRLSGGTVVDVRQAARSNGTTVLVRNLFGRVPARRKFLKSVSTEAAHCSQVVSQYALAYPEIGFILTVEGRKSLQTPGNGNMVDAVAAVYGVEVARQMLEVGNGYSGEDPDVVTVSGVVSAPGVSRSNRTSISLFVNRRWVNSRMLTWSVEEAYHGLLMTGRHPIAVISLSLPPREVDVNVHPAKLEVKFHNERAVFGAVQKAVRQSLVTMAPVPQVHAPTAQYTSQTQSGFTPEPWKVRPAQKPSQQRMLDFEETIPDTPRTTLPLLRVLGQVGNDYIIAEGPDGVYIIDQHAAHERVRFDALKQQLMEHSVEVQGLLEPLTFEVDPRQDELLREQYEALQEYGFTIEPFGVRIWLIRAIPALLPVSGCSEVLHEILDGVAERRNADWQEVILSSVACHHAVRAGQKMTIEEMEALVQSLSRTDIPNTCPHGRPTIIHLTLDNLEKQFGRT